MRFRVTVVKDDEIVVRTSSKEEEYRRVVEVVTAIAEIHLLRIHLTEDPQWSPVFGRPKTIGEIFPREDNVMKVKVPTGTDSQELAIEIAILIERYTGYDCLL